MSFEPCPCGSGQMTARSMCHRCRCSWSPSYDAHCWERPVSAGGYCHHHQLAAAGRDRELAMQSTRRLRGDLVLLQKTIVRCASQQMLRYSRALEAIDDAGRILALVLEAHVETDGAAFKSATEWKAPIHPDESLVLEDDGQLRIYGEARGFLVSEWSGYEAEATKRASTIRSRLVDAEPPAAFANEMKNAGMLDKINAALIYIGANE